MFFVLDTHADDATRHLAQVHGEVFATHKLGDDTNVVFAQEFTRSCDCGFGLFRRIDHTTDDTIVNQINFATVGVSDVRD